MLAFFKSYFWVLVLAALFLLALLSFRSDAINKVDASNRQVQLLYVAQISACEQNNELRVEANRRIESQSALATGLLDFLDAGRLARLEDNDFDVAAQFGRIERRVRSSAPVYKIDKVDCKALIPLPVFD
jgi:hypothetical protein